MKKIAFLLLIKIIVIGHIHAQSSFPEVGLKLKTRELKMDSTSFKKTLKTDLFYFDAYGKINAENYSDETPTTEALIKILNPDFDINPKKYLLDSTSQMTYYRLVVPSQELLYKYVKAKTNFSEKKLDDEFTSFDFILYPTLRDSLEVALSNVLGCEHFDEKNVKQIKEFKWSIESMLTRNLPTTKSTLDILLHISTNIGGQTHRNCGADDEVDVNYFDVYKEVGFDILKGAIEGKTNDVPVIIQTVDKKGNLVKKIDVYYAPVWAPSYIQKISSLTSPIKINLPIADYNFWSDTNDRDKAPCPCNCLEGIKVRSQSEPKVVILICN